MNAWDSNFPRGHCFYCSRKGRLLLQAVLTSTGDAVAATTEVVVGSVEAAAVVGDTAGREAEAGGATPVAATALCKGTAVATNITTTTHGTIDII